MLDVRPSVLQYSILIFSRVALLACRVTHVRVRCAGIKGAVVLVAFCSLASVCASWRDMCDCSSATDGVMSLGCAR
jgi:hypothetical protein